MRISSVWEPVDSFTSESDFSAFERLLAQQLGQGAAHEIDVGLRYAAALRERWFVRNDSREVWRLIAPNGRFPGLWTPVHVV